MNSLTDFIQNELYPALFERLDSAFPDMGFKRRGKVWESPKHLNGADSSDGQGSYSSERYFGRIADRNGSDSLSFVDFEAERLGYGRGVKGEQLIPVLERLCSVCGLSLPQTDTAEYTAYRERQEALLRICKRMEEALFNPKGADVLKYLKEQRGYSEELIKRMGLGALTPETEEQLKSLKLLTDVKGSAGKWHKVSDYYKLSIPYISGGRLRGIKFRIIQDGIEFPDGGKPHKYHNTNGSGLKESLFGLSGARLTGAGSDKDITIVEGELDALRAQAVGLAYVVAATGGELNSEALSELRRKGADKITLLFDRAERGSKDEEQLPGKIEKALQQIRKAHLRGYVAEFPIQEDGAKMDLDSYLGTHSAEELRSILSEAIPEALWLFNRERDKAIAKQGGEGERCTLKDFEDLKYYTLRLSNSDYITPTERALLFKAYQAATGGDIISSEDIQAEADAIKAEQDRELQAERTKELHSKAAELLKDGKTEEALLLMRNGAGQLERISRETEYSHYLNEDIDSLFEEYKGQEGGVPTNISLRFDAQEYRFILPSGALTFIGGATGHGKSRLLQSLALDLATDGQPGEILYISYEENRKNVNRQLLNAYMDIDLTEGNNEQTLQEYLCNGSTRFIKRAALPELERKLPEYKAIREKKLRLIKPEDNTIETLEGLLRYAFRDRDRTIRAVFIDYVQELYSDSPKRGQSRSDELKEICVSLDLVAQEVDAPIVLGAQLKAEGGAESPLSLSNQDIADSINIPRKASEILLLWSSAERPLKDKDGVEFDRIKRELPELHIGERGTIYAKLTKSRFLPKGATAFLHINGNTGRIRGNYKEPTQTEAKTESTQGNIFNTADFDRK